MSIVAPPPLNLPTFSETEMYTASGAASAHAELPPSQPPVVARNLVPFPMFQQRHSSPYPMPQSFSALGPPDLGSSPLSGAPVPPAPKPQPIGLPVLAPDGTEVHAQSPLPPTPDPSPPSSKVLFPTAMVKLAPPADDSPYSSDSASAQIVIHDGTPRRLPTISIDKIATESPTAASGSGPSRTRAQSTHSVSGAALESSSARPKSMGPPSRPIRRSQTLLPPNSVRMSHSNSADSRSRLRTAAGARQPNANVLNARKGSPGLSRTFTDSAVTPPRSQLGGSAASADAPDLGGPDGLEAKVVLLGSQGVGKTSLILRYTTRIFSVSPAAATIGSSLHTRKLVHSGVRVKLQIWDTAGQERFRSMAPIYYRGAHVCVLVYDISDRQSFQDVRSWLEELQRTVPKETVIYVVGAKIDLESRRAVSIEEARRTLRSWLRPPPAPASTSTPLAASAPSKGLFRSASSATRHTDSEVPSSGPTRSHSSSALTVLDRPHQSVPPPKPARASSKPRTEEPSPSRSDAAVVVGAPSTGASSTSRPSASSSSISRPSADSSGSSRPDARISGSSRPDARTSETSRPFPALMITPVSPTSPRSKRVSFPALPSPTKPTFATFTEPVTPALASSPPSRHGVSGGRFSISGVLGYSRTSSMSGAVSNLARLAEEYPASRVSLDRPSMDGRGGGGHGHGGSGGGSGGSGVGADLPVRVRVESSPALTGPSIESQRRRSEDWSSRSWRMGEGPSAAEALGEFGDGVKRKESGELLSSAMSAKAATKATKGATKTAKGATKTGVGVGVGMGVGEGQGASAGLGMGGGTRTSGMGAGTRVQPVGRARGGSLGRDSRLYGDDASSSSSDEGANAWGVEVEGVRIGECSALTGEGVEALFKSISSLLVEKKDKIERERILRHKNSIMLTAPEAARSDEDKGQGRYGCCA